MPGNSDTSRSAPWRPRAAAHGSGWTLHRAATIQRRLSDRSREAMALDGTSEAYREMGQPDEAVSFHLRAAALRHSIAARRLGDAEPQAAG
jgi:hypothetical protein